MSRSCSGGSRKNKYVPGDITSFINQHPSKSILYTQQDSQEKIESVKNGAQSLTAGMNKINLEPIKSPNGPSKSNSSKLREARAKSAFAAAYYNFQTAKKMAQDNLDHQPLPDAILDKNFTELQAQGDPNPGLGLDVNLTTTGIGYKGYKVGPTQCTKLKVYRPKTCGVLPKHLDKSTMSNPADGEPIRLDPKIGQMDLAIRWDYRPKNREPKLPKHIDGTNDIVNAVFTLVQQVPQEKENALQFERAEGVFHNTQGEIDFFDRDLILKRKDYQKKYEKGRDCTCGTDVASFANVPGSESIVNKNRPKTTRSDSILYSSNGEARRCKSSPNLSMLVNPTLTEPSTITTEIEDPRKIPMNQLPRETSEQKKALRQPRYAHQMVPRLCHQMRHDYERMMKKYFLTNELIKLDENNNCPLITETPPINKQKVIYVPRPKQPYKKKNYQIDSLAPPFSSWTGRGDEFPNHLRLASIYQQAYKSRPVESRKRRFLQSIHRNLVNTHTQRTQRSFINSLILLFVISILNDFALTQRQTSPCPSVFSYDTDRETSDTWYGTLKLETSVPLHGITVDVILDSRASTFGAYYFNDVTTHDYKEYRVENKNFKLDPGRTLVMNVYVRYDETTPLLKQVRLNGQNICVDLPSVAPVQPIYPSNINSQQTTTTRSVTRREQHPGRQYSFDFNYAQNNEPASRPTQTTSNSNDFRQSNGSNVYNENNYSQFSGHETERPYSNVNPSRDVTNNNRDVYNQPREILPNSVGFVSDSLSGTSNSGNGRNVNSASVTQRPYSQQTTTTLNYDNNRRATQSTTYYDSNSNNNRRTTTTTANYDYNVFPRTTAPTYRPNRDVTTRRSTYFQGDLPFLNKNNNNDDNDETSTHSILNVDSDSQCGSVIPKVNPLIVHGEETYQGQFPWHAALYLSDIGSLRYICGGSLVSMNAVVTAAHCVTHEKTKRSINSDKVLVYLGKTSLQKWTGPEQDAKVAEIVVNHEYDPERFYSDIAILKLKDSLAKTNFVRPVCLWNLETDLKLIVNKLGAVPGWGYNENGLVSEDLSYVKMPVVTHETCIWSNRDFFSKVTSEKSFCAGFRNGSTICNGDSGGGMVFKQGKQYFLRGVVSISIALQNSLKCDPNHFAVFVDAAKYTTWIKQNI